MSKPDLLPFFAREPIGSPETHRRYKHHFSNRFLRIAIFGVSVGIFFSGTHDAHLIAAIIFVAGIVLNIIFWPRPFERTILIQIDNDGIHDFQWQSSFVAWQDIARIENVESGEGMIPFKYVALYVKSDARHKPYSLNEYPTGDLKINAALTDRSHRELLAAIERFRPKA